VTSHLPAAAGSVSTSTTLCARTSGLPAASALHQLRRAPRLVVSRPQRLYINYAVHPDTSSRRSTSLRSVALAHVVRPVTSSPGCTGSISTLSRAVSPLDFLSVGRTGCRRASGHHVSRRDYSSSGLHQLYCAYVVHPDAPSRRSTSCQSVALALCDAPGFKLPSLTLMTGPVESNRPNTGQT
jgi:hypothetical protein